MNAKIQHIQWVLNFQDKDGDEIYITQKYLDELGLTENDNVNLIMEKIKEKEGLNFKILSFIKVKENKTVFFFESINNQCYVDSWDMDRNNMKTCFFIDQYNDGFVFLATYLENKEYVITQ